MTTWANKINERASGAELSVANEPHVVGEFSAGLIFLAEIPLLESPSTVSLTLDTVAATEVTGVPAAGEYKVHYSGTLGGAIEFNAADAGKTVAVSYKGTGSGLFSVDVNRLQTEKVDRDGSIPFTGSILPSATATHNVGSDTYRWATVFAGDGDFSGDVLVGGAIIVNTTNTLGASIALKQGGTASGFLAAYSVVSGVGTDYTPTLFANSGLGIKFAVAGSPTVVAEILPTGMVKFTNPIGIGASPLAYAKIYLAGVTTSAGTEAFGIRFGHELGVGAGSSIAAQIFMNSGTYHAHGFSAVAAYGLYLDMSAPTYTTGGGAFGETAAINVKAGTGGSPNYAIKVTSGLSYFGGDILVGTTVTASGMKLRIVGGNLSTEGSIFAGGTQGTNFFGFFTSGSTSQIAVMTWNGDNNNWGPTFYGGRTSGTYTELARFASTTGNFLIGTTTDGGYKLSVNGTTLLNNTTYIGALGQITWGAYPYFMSNSGYGVGLYASGTTAKGLTIDNNGAATFSHTLAVTGVATLSTVNVAKTFSGGSGNFASGAHFDTAVPASGVYTVTTQSGQSAWTGFYLISYVSGVIYISAIQGDGNITVSDGGSGNLRITNATAGNIGSQFVALRLG